MLKHKKQNNKSDVVIIVIAIASIVLFIFFAWYMQNKNFLRDAKNTKLEFVKAVNENDHYLGNIEAPVQMIIYGDFDDSFCADYSVILKELKNEFKEDVVIAFRHFPMRMNIFSFEAGLASECAGEQEKFWEMHDMIFMAKIANNLDSEQLKQIAKDIGLDEEMFNECLSSEKYSEKIETQEEEGRACGVTGVPATFVNTHVYPGSYPLDDFTGSDDRPRIGLRNVIQGYLDEIETE